MQRIVLALLLFSRRSWRAKTRGDRGISAQTRGATSRTIEVGCGAVQSVRKWSLGRKCHIRRVVAGAPIRQFERKDIAPGNAALKGAAGARAERWWWWRRRKVILWMGVVLAVMDYVCEVAGDALCLL